MKYPQNQFELLKQAMAALSKHVDLNSVHPCMLHGIVYEQYAESGQNHNKFLIDGNGKLIRSATLVGGELVWNEGKRLIKSNSSFELYPDGCNDTHIETAVKRAIKETN